MTAKAAAWAQRTPRRALAILAAVIAAAALLAAHAAAPYLVGKTTLQNELAVQLKATSGLRILAHHARFALLPRPRVVAEAVRVDEPSGAFALDADGLTGDVRLLPLVVGRIELASVTLRRPRIAIDLAAGRLDAASTVGRALSGRAGLGDRAEAVQRLGSLVLEDGTLQLRRGGGATLVLAGIDAAVDWRDLDAAASLTGSLRLGTERVDLDLRLGSPAALPRGEASAVVLHAHSPMLDLAATGTLAAVEGIRPMLSFRGRLSAAAPALGALVARVAPGIVLPAAFADTSLDAEARIVADGTGLATLDLQKLALRADGNEWEGTLAFRRGPRPLISATLATEQLSLAPFMTSLPGPLDAGRRWSRATLPRLRIGDADLDLRISAARLAWRPLTIDDAAFSVISRDGRLEVALIEGRLSGGALKARLSIGDAGPDLDLRGTAALTGADASTLSWDLAGRQLATGTLSASLNLQGRGDSLAALIAGASGSAKAALVDGDISDPGPMRGHTAVRSLDAAATIRAGVAAIEDAMLIGPALTSTGRGTLDLRSRTLDFRAAQARSGGSGDDAITISGPLDDLRIAPAGTQPPATSATSPVPRP